MDKIQMKKLEFNDIEIKQIGTDGIIEAKITTEDVDRSGEKISISGMDLNNFKTNMVVLWSHLSKELPIGKALRLWKSGDSLMAKFQLAINEYDFAAVIYRLIKGGYLKAISIGFIPKDFDNETKTYTRSELLEFSLVNLPDNAKAMITRKGIIDPQVFKDLETGKTHIKDIKEKDLYIEEKDNTWKKELEEKINILEKTVSALKETKVENNASGVRKTYEIGKISSQVIEEIQIGLKNKMKGQNGR